MEPKKNQASKAFIVAIGDCNYGAGRSKEAALRQARAWFKSVGEKFSIENVEYFELNGFAARYAIQHRNDGYEMGRALNLPEIECPSSAVVCMFGDLPFGVGKTRREALAAAKDALGDLVNEYDDDEIDFFNVSGLQAAMACAAAAEGLSGNELHKGITDAQYL